MRKILFYSLVLILIFWADFSFSQESKTRKSQNNLFLGVGGMSFLGASINYEYSLALSDLFRVNPGIGLGYEYRSTDMNSAYYFNAYPALKVLIGKEKHFFELGMYVNIAYDNIFGGTLGYRYSPTKGCFFIEFPSIEWSIQLQHPFGED